MTARKIKERLGEIESGGIVIDSTGTERTVNRAFADPAALGDNLLIAAQGVGIKIRVLAYIIHGGGAVSARFRSAANSISGLMVLASGTQVGAPFTAHGWFETNANEALNLNLSAAVAAGIEFLWIQTT